MKVRSGRKETGLSTAVILGLGISIAVVLLGTIVLSFSIIQGTLSESTTRYITPFIVFLAVFIGAYISAKLVEKEKLLVCIGVAGTLLFILLATTILLFEGRFQNVIVGILSIVAGCAGAYLLNLRQPKTKYRRRR